MSRTTVVVVGGGPALLPAQAVAAYKGADLFVGRFEEPFGRKRGVPGEAVGQASVGGVAYRGRPSARPRAR
ncbi:hypothetical protein AB0E25_23155 [Streptomyces bobili]|uniref:hypothetical protein n=1 Tax=Streptomyces bobili TaxID=67280 RepID=UPI0033F0C783